MSGSVDVAASVGVDGVEGFDEPASAAGGEAVGGSIAASSEHAKRSSAPMRKTFTSETLA
jgi:hypothetical protein